MLIFGHKLIETPKFHLINNDNASFKESINCFEYDENLIEKALKEGVKFAILAKNEDENLAKKASKMAEFYLFDSKILLITNSLKKLEKAYKMGVDGVILKELLQEI